MVAIRIESCIATLALLGAMSPGTALAVDLQPRFSPAAARTYVPQPPPCTCRGRGGDEPLGASLCLQTPDGWRVAVCVRAQNVTSWQAGEEGCAPVSALSPASPTLGGG